MRKAIGFVTTSAILFLFIATANSQPWPTCPLYEIHGPTGSSQCWSVAAIGDLNGDGKDDFIAGFPFADSAGAFDAGYAAVYSGVDGSVLFQTYGVDYGVQGGYLGFAVAGVGDVNGDSVPDFIIGAPSASPDSQEVAGSVYVYSGADDSLLYQRDGSAAGDEFGASVDGVGDVNGDSVPDFIIGAPGKDTVVGHQAFSSFVFVYSGTDDSLLYYKYGIPGATSLGGSTAAGAGDVNGDGTPDFIAGGGDVRVYSGADGSLLFQKVGNIVDGAGDVNDDGKADVIVADLGVGNDEAYVYSGADSSLLFQKIGDSLGSSIETVTGIGDVDGDEKSDFLVGGGAGDALAFLFSGADGSLLFKFSIEGAGSVVSASAGDVNGDGKLDIIVAAGDAVYVFETFCRAAKGDMNADSNLAPSDVVLLLTCTFLGTGPCCALCFADVNCSGDLSPADVVIELNMVFLAASPPC